MSTTRRPPLSIEQATEIVLASIAQVAPDVEPELGTFDRNRDFFDEFELDSMDHANVMTQLWDRAGAAPTETDYPAMRSVSAIASFLVAATIQQQ